MRWQVIDVLSDPLYDIWKCCVERCSKASAECHEICAGIGCFDLFISEMCKGNRQNT